MNIRKVLTILRFELAVNLLSRRFLWSLAGLPLIVLTIVLITAGARRITALAVSTAPLGIIDLSGFLTQPGKPCANSSIGKSFELPGSGPTLPARSEKKPAKNTPIAVICFQDLAAAESSLRSGAIDRVVMLPKKFPNDLDIAEYVKTSEDTNTLSGSLALSGFERYLKSLLIESTHLPNALRKLLDGPLDYRQVELLQIAAADSVNSPGEHSDSHGARNTGLKYWGIIVVIFSGSIGFHCTRTERSTKLIEVILSSVTASEYLLGKVIAATIFVFVQFSCWFGMGWLALIALASRSGDSGVPSLSILSLSSQSAWIIAFAVVGSVCANLLGATFGVIGKINDEKSASSLPFALIQQGGVVLALYVAFNPGSQVAVTTSFIPPLSASVMIARIGSQHLTLIDTVFSMTTLCLASFIFMFIAARFMRASLAMNGQRLSFSALRSALRA